MDAFEFRSEAVVECCSRSVSAIYATTRESDNCLLLADLRHVRLYHDTLCNPGVLLFN
jgi:hypothetical protein